MTNVEVDHDFLGSFRREPAMRPEIDRMSFEIKEIDGVKRLCWMYEDKCYITSFDANKPNAVLVCHLVPPVGSCFSHFTLDSNKNMIENNVQKGETWHWIRT